MDLKNNRVTIITTVIITAVIIAFFSVFFASEIKKASASNKDAKENAAAKTQTVKKVSFVGVGDNLIHDTIYQAADRRAGVYGDGKYDFYPLYKHIKKDIEKYDIKYINEESIIAGDGYGIHAYPQFNAPEVMIPTLTDTGFNLINMANNHALDMGSKAVDDSIDLWNRTDVYHTGLYKSQKERETPLIIEKNGIKIAVLSYTYDTNGIRPDKEFKVPYLNEEKIRQDVDRVRGKCDFILVSAHWGDEHIEAVSPLQQKYANLFNELGVDVVLGTHAHIIQKAEWLTNKNGKKTLIYYGTGNFVHNMLGAKPYLEGMASWNFVKKGDKTSIEDAKFTPLVFHLEANQYGYDGSVYRLDEYPVELANRHITMRGAGAYNLEVFRNTVNRLIPKDMIDMKTDTKAD